MIPDPPAARKEAATEKNAEESHESDTEIVVDMERTYTIRQLKDMCTERSLSTAGKKSELVRRITEHDRSNSS